MRSEKTDLPASLLLPLHHRSPSLTFALPLLLLFSSLFLSFPLYSSLLLYSQVWVRSLGPLQAPGAARGPFPVRLHIPLSDTAAAQGAVRGADEVRREGEQGAEAAEERRGSAVGETGNVFRLPVT